MANHYFISFISTMSLCYSSRPSPGDIPGIIIIQLIMLLVVSNIFGVAGFIVYCIILGTFAYFIFSENSNYDEEALIGLYIFTFIGICILPFVGEFS